MFTQNIKRNKIIKNTHSSGYFSGTAENTSDWTMNITYFQSSYPEYGEAEKLII